MVNQVQAVGKLFDPNIHEGFTMVPTNEYGPNTVIDVFEKGYILDGFPRTLNQAEDLEKVVEKRKETNV